MEPSQPRSNRRGGRGQVMLVGALVAALLAAGLAACSDDGDDDSASATVVVDMVVDEDFPGDALDATCARLEAAAGDDRDATAVALLDELIALGDADLAMNTMELAVIDRCPEWSDAVTAAIAAHG